MNDIDALLRDAGERWRATQPAPGRVDPAMFVSTPRRFAVSWMTAAAAVVTLATVFVLGFQFGRSPGVGGQPLGGPSAEPSVAMASPPGAARSPSLSPDAVACDVTRPDPIFVPPAGYLREPPRSHGTEWYGSAGLWTLLDRDGEVWRDLPVSPEGLTQKTVWWSANWTPEAELEPDIIVSGRRLDALGDFWFSPGTNASAPGYDTAMMVGIDVPAAGCWEITGTYRGVSLTYVVLVVGD